MTEPRILVINAGSSSIKAAVFDGGLTERARVQATGIGATGEVRVGSDPAQPCDLPDHVAALDAVFARVRERTAYE